MEYAKLGRSGLRVSRLCLGTMNLGKHVDERTSFALLDAAVDAGINFIDTADVYGGIGFRGRTEEIIGRWLHKVAGGGRRSSSPRRSTARWGMGRMNAACPRTTSGTPAKTVCDDYRPITSISTKCTTSTGLPPGKKSGRQWVNSSRREKSSIPEAATCGLAHR